MEKLLAWLTRLVRRPSGLGHSSSQIRVIFIAMCCVLLGYVVTSAFRNDAGFSAPVWTADDTSGYDTGSTNTVVEKLSNLHHAVSNGISSWTANRGAGGRDSRTKNKNDPNRSFSGMFSNTERYNDSDSSETVSEDILRSNRQLLGEKTRVGKVTMIYAGDANIYERALRTHELHDRMHGYHLHVLRHTLLDDVWSKPGYILHVLLRELAKPKSERLEWLFWVDADTIILNPNIPIETFLPPSPEFDDVNLLVTNDFNGLNNGVFPIRVNHWAVDLFASIVAYRDFRPDDHLTFRDQSAMGAMLAEPKFARHTVYAPQRWFNAYQGEVNETLSPFQVRRGDFLVHFAGVMERTERMTYWLERVEQHLPDWELELQHTSFPAETHEFWLERRASRNEAVRTKTTARIDADELLSVVAARLGEYQTRLSDSQITEIRAREVALRDALEKPDELMDVAAVKEASRLLMQAKEPLETIMAEAKQTLLKQAHEAIFAAEKELMYHDSESALVKESADLEAKAAALKSLVMQPSWDKVELNQRMDELLAAKTSLQDAGVSLAKTETEGGSTETDRSAVANGSEESSVSESVDIEKVAAAEPGVAIVYVTATVATEIVWSTETALVEDQPAG